MLRVITPAATNDLTTLATVKRELGISDSDNSQNGRLADMISTASDLITQYCNRDTFGRETVEQTSYRHRASAIILERDLPATIVSVTENEVLLDSSYYYLDDTILRRIYYNHTTSGTWHSWGPFGYMWGAGKTVIVYETGFTLLGNLPRSLERACLDVVFSLHASSTRDQTIRSETVDGIGTTVYAQSAQGALPVAPDRLKALDRYRHRPGM